MRKTELGLALAAALTLGGCNQIFGVSELSFEADAGGQQTGKRDGGRDATVAADAGVDATADGRGGDAKASSSDSSSAQRDGGAIPPSCAPGGPGMSNCGADGGESCCESPHVAGGTFYRTYLNNGSGATGEAAPAIVSGFRLEKYLVTVGRFRQYVNAWNGGAGYEPDAGSGKHAYLNTGRGLVAVGADAGADAGLYEMGWVVPFDNLQVGPNTVSLASGPYCTLAPTWTASAGSQENLPINCVNWYEAYAFCIWDGGFLPSEAEWEYVAAGGSLQNEYPWGSAQVGATGTKQANDQYVIAACEYPSSSTSTSCDGGYYDAGVTHIAPVGTTTAGAALWGQLDMAGELDEWTLDWYDANYVDPCTDCAYLTATTAGFVIRGGYFKTTYPYVEIQNDRTFSKAVTATGRSEEIGFRCARAP